MYSETKLLSFSSRQSWLERSVYLIVLLWGSLTQFSISKMPVVVLAPKRNPCLLFLVVPIMSNLLPRWTFRSPFGRVNIRIPCYLISLSQTSPKKLTNIFRAAYLNLIHYYLIDLKTERTRAKITLLLSDRFNKLFLKSCYISLKV